MFVFLFVKDQSESEFKGDGNFLKDIRLKPIFAHIL